MDHVCVLVGLADRLFGLGHGLTSKIQISDPGQENIAGFRDGQSQVRRAARIIGVGDRDQK